MGIVNAQKYLVSKKIVKAKSLNLKNKKEKTLVYDIDFCSLKWKYSPFLTDTYSCLIYLTNYIKRKVDETSGTKIYIDVGKINIKRSVRKKRFIERKKIYDRDDYEIDDIGFFNLTSKPRQQGLSKEEELHYFNADDIPQLSSLINKQNDLTEILNDRVEELLKCQVFKTKMEKALSALNYYKVNGERFQDIDEEQNQFTNSYIKCYENMFNQKYSYFFAHNNVGYIKYYDNKYVGELFKIVFGEKNVIMCEGVDAEFIIVKDVILASKINDITEHIIFSNDQDILALLLFNAVKNKDYRFSFKFNNDEVSILNDKFVNLFYKSLAMLLLLLNGNDYFPGTKQILLNENANYDLDFEINSINDCFVAIMIYILLNKSFKKIQKIKTINDEDKENYKLLFDAMFTYLNIDTEFYKMDLSFIEKIEPKTYLDLFQYLLWYMKEHDEEFFIDETDLKLEKCSSDECDYYVVNGNDYYYNNKKYNILIPTKHLVPLKEDCVVVDKIEFKKINKR